MPDGWAIAGVIASSTSSLIAAGALWVAVTTQRRQEEDKRRQQAAKVTLSRSFVKTPTKSGVVLAMELRVDNLSDLPIYQVVLITSLEPALESKRIDMLNNAATTQINDVTERIDPGHKMTFSYLLGERFADARREYPAAVAFRDASGTRWSRFISGVLLSSSSGRGLGAWVRRSLAPRRLGKHR